MDITQGAGLIEVRDYHAGVLYPKHGGARNTRFPKVFFAEVATPSGNEDILELAHSAHARMQF